MKHTYQRYIWLYTLLLSHPKGLSLREINEVWENATSLNPDGKSLNRTIFQEHLSAIGEMFGVEVVCDRHAGYRYYIQTTNTLQDQANSLLLNYLSVSKAGDLKDRVVIGDVMGGVEHLGGILDAMRHNQLIEVHYQPFHKDCPIVLQGKPYGVKLYANRWYVVGKWDQYAEVRNFPLDRIKMCKTLQETFCYTADDCPSYFYENCIGTFVQGKPQRVRLRVQSHMVADFKALPFHKSQELLEENSEFADFQYFLCVTGELVRVLLSKGADIEVLEPAVLRDMVKTEAEKIWAKYK